jgi:hypothetical protein
MTDATHTLASSWKYIGTNRSPRKGSRGLGKENQRLRKLWKQHHYALHKTVNNHRLTKLVKRSKEVLAANTTFGTSDQQQRNSFTKA